MLKFFFKLSSKPLFKLAVLVVLIILLLRFIGVLDLITFNSFNILGAIGIVLKELVDFRLPNPYLPVYFNIFHCLLTDI